MLEGSAGDAAWEAVLTELAERREEFHAQSYVPRDFVGRLKGLGLFRASTPARFGGAPLPPPEFLRAVERISSVDGSTGWVAGFGSAGTYLACLPPETQAEVYAEGPDVVYGGAMFPVNPVTRTERGYLVSGRWRFASGCMAADLLSVGIPGDADGDNRPRAAVLRPEQVEIVRDWDVTGMRASGSFDVVVRDVEVPHEWTFVRGGASCVDEPLYHYPTIGYQAQVHAAVGLGVAGAALDFAARAGSRTGVTGAPPLADRAYYRTGYAQAVASLRSARAFYYEVAQDVWDTVAAGGEASDEQNAQIRLSATHVAATAARVVHEVCGFSGTATIDNSHPLQRMRQDSQVPALHAFLMPSMYDAAGSVLLGRPPTVPGFR
ncbi:acyl-CoA dehydrogenase family protein [Saccharopolyspora flava]|uniref:Acyl-CoA dehydrogenase n=1 Tax=Saccharopolyspora flava TaxID=95161 RepID=A0A1I6S5A9_9PSEU|nr:acyl-CoA dehydrogenase family protein [Saccharopolyspora flava]SFS72122.1 Acyl-CoA dehydrogenase [Saccharopolyspora flava]